MAWMAANLRANHLAVDGGFLLGHARTSADPGPQLKGAAEDFRAARRVSPDARVLVQEGAVLAAIGYPRRGEALALRATRLEPENIQAWSALYSATRGHDPALAARAKRKVLELDPSAAR